MSSGKFYLQDSRKHAYVGDGLAFHCKDGRGYAADLSKAELMTLEEAINANQRRSTDIPWPQEYIDARAHEGVDHQYVKVDEANKTIIPGTMFAFQIPNRYNGNDLCWKTYDGDCTFDFDKAAIGSVCAGSILWPLDYIRTKTRRLVHRDKVSIKEALRGTGIKLKREKPYKPPTCKCEHCGRFISNGDRFSPCPNCGGDNRP